MAGRGSIFIAAALAVIIAISCNKKSAGPAGAAFTPKLAGVHYWTGTIYSWESVAGYFADTVSDTTYNTNDTFAIIVVNNLTIIDSYSQNTLTYLSGNDSQMQFRGTTYQQIGGYGYRVDTVTLTYNYRANAISYYNQVNVGNTMLQETRLHSQ